MVYKEPQLPTSNETEIRIISGFVASGATPTGRPRNFFQQFRIVSGVLYFYDTILNAWHSATAAAGGGDTHVQYNDGGTLLGGDAGFTWDKVLKKLTITGPNSGGFDTLLEIFGSLNSIRLDWDGTIYSLLTNRFLNISGSSGLGLNNSSLGTSTDDGFIYIPYMNGTPTGTPATTPALVYDTSAHKLWAYQGGSWRSVTFT